jgi:DNA polymerase-3 subunit gamma/tau
LSALELLANTGDEGMQVVPLDEFVESMIDRDPGRALTVVAHAISAGMDPRTLTEELIAFLRNGFLALMAPELVQVPSNRLDALAAQAQRLGAAGLVRGIELLGASLSEMRHAPDPRVLLDVATVQLTADSAGGDTAALVQRLERLERQVAAGAVAAPVEKAPAPRDPATGRAALGGRARPSTTAAPEPVAPESAAPGTPAAVDAADTSPEPVAPPPSATSRNDITADVWENSIRPALRGMARAVYGPAGFIRSTDSTLTLSVPNAVHRAKCEEQRSVVEAALASYVGGPVTVELIDDGGGGAGGGPSARTSADAAASSVSAAPAEPTPERAPHDDAQAVETSSPRERGLAAAAAAVAGPVDDLGVGAGLDELPDDDEVDLDDLTDAPPESVKSPIDRLAEAFPGSELIEEAG